MNVDINTLNNIKEQIESLYEDDALFIEKDGIAKYAIIPIETYDKVEDLLSVINGGSGAEVKVVGENAELSYEEYERIKAMIMDAVEKTFKPKADKLN